jgi:predicted choloylglycine hydrolase
MSIEVSSSLPLVEIDGSPFEVGVALGRHGRDIVHRHLIRTHGWASVIAFAGHERIVAARALVEAHFPRYFEELHGLAKGLELPFDEVFAWNCRGDIRAIAPDGCTTVMLPGQRLTLAHNEDGDPGLRPGCAIVRIASAGGRAFFGFVYPGSLPGHTFALNDAGLAMAVNNIRSRQTGPGMPRMVLCRAVLDCGTVREALDMLRSSQRAAAFHISLAQPGNRGIASVEFTHSACSVRQVDAPEVHANHLIHDGTREERQRVTASSRSRQERGEEILAGGVTGVEPLAVLWDRQRTALPIYREQPDDPDGENTLATAVFRIDMDRIACEIYDRAHAAPLFRFEERRSLLD